MINWREWRKGEKEKRVMWKNRKRKTVRTKMETEVIRDGKVMDELLESIEQSYMVFYD